MKVIKRASEMGFCMGVERAVSIVRKVAEELKEQGCKAVTLGPIIHNQQIVDHFAAMGIPAVDSVEEINSGKAIVRAHGIPPSQKRELEKKGIEIIDGTCPKVIASHKTVEKYSRMGYHIVIVGDRNHGEIQGLAGYASDYHIIESAEEAGKLTLPPRTMVISQTTIKEREFESVCRILRKKNPGLVVHNSICSATNNRQQAVIKLAGEVDAVVVIGGKNSANTQRLYHTVKELGKPCWHISGADELPPEIAGFDIIGLTAGASTPNWIVDEVEEKLKKL